MDFYLRPRAAWEEERYAHEKEKKPAAPDGGLLVPAGGGSPCSAGPLAGAAARCPGAAGGTGLRQGPLHGGDRRRPAGRAADRRGKGPRRHGGGHGAGPGGRSAQCIFCGRRCRLPAGVFRPRRGGPHLHQFLRPLAQKQPEKAPPDPRQFPAIIPPGAAPGRRDPLQKRQRQAVRVVFGGDPPVRLPAVPGHPGPSRRRPRGGHDGLRGQILPAGRHHQPVRGHHGSLGSACGGGGEKA